MDRLWATWRMAYITGKHKDTGCVFCNAICPHYDKSHKKIT